MRYVRATVKHLALAVTDQEKSRRFYESYFGFDARPRGGTTTVCSCSTTPTDSHSPSVQQTSRSSCRSFCTSGSTWQVANVVQSFRDRLVADGVPIVEEWDEPNYVGVKCLDPDGTSWKPRGNHASPEGAPPGVPSA